MLNFTKKIKPKTYLYKFKTGDLVICTRRINSKVREFDIGMIDTINGHGDYGEYYSASFKLKDGSYWYCDVHDYQIALAEELPPPIPEEAKPKKTTSIETAKLLLAQLTLAVNSIEKEFGK